MQFITVARFMAGPMAGAAGIRFWSFLGWDLTRVHLVLRGNHDWLFCRESIRSVAHMITAVISR